MERKYKIDKDDIWILNSFLDTEYPYETFTDEFIEENFYKQWFHITLDEKIIFNYEVWFDFSKEFRPISNLEIIERFGVKILDEIIEKTFVKLK